MALPPRSLCLLLAAAAGLPAPAAAEADAFCCLAASDLGDACGTCFPAAVAGKDSECGPSEAACGACGSSTTWCAGGGAAAQAPRALQDPPPAEGAAREALQVDTVHSAPAGFDVSAAASDGVVSTAAKKAKEIVIMLDKAPPAELEEGAEVTIEALPLRELSDGAHRGSSHPKKAHAESGWMSPFLICEGVGAAAALMLAAFYHSEARRKSAALEAVHAFGGKPRGPASPGVPSPGMMERGPQSPNKTGGGRGYKQGGGFNSPTAARSRGAQSPATEKAQQSPEEASQMSSFLSFAGYGRQDVEFRVVLDKTTGRTIGATALEIEEGTLEITGVTGDLLEQWNRSHPELAVKRGDRITEVNGVKEWWTKNKKLELVVKRRSQV